MRLTTKITIGIILSILVISLAFIIAFSFSDRKNYTVSPLNYENVEITVSEYSHLETGSYKVVVLDKYQVDPNVHHYWFTDECTLSFNPVSTENERDKLAIPVDLAGFITMNTLNDTLTIKVKLDELGQKYEKADKDNVAISGMNLKLHTSTVNVINKLNGVVTEIRNIETDEIKVNAESHVHIHGCDANTLTILKAGLINIENSKFKKLSFDNLQSWKIENCRIYHISDE
ncbi:MAG: hypothetical protein LBV72_17920 [Tannerella sp.]|jgi:hypothetical protein|nr:hypothetical protein [Tannerella sp.]